MQDLSDTTVVSPETEEIVEEGTDVESDAAKDAVQAAPGRLDSPIEQIDLSTTGQ